MYLLLAASPILVAVGLILLLRQSALIAGLAGFGLALALAFLVPDFALGAAGLGRALARGLLITVTVAYVLLGGVLLYQVLRAGGALETLSRAVARAIPGEAQRLLTLIFGLSVFFESVTGFGVGIIVTAPLLMALGYAPLQAGILALIGQCAVTWGALAIGTLLGADLSGLPASVLGAWAVPLGFPYLVASGALALRIAGLWRVGLVGWLLLYALVLSLGLWLGSITLGVELAGSISGLAILLLGLLPGLLSKGRCGAEVEPVEPVAPVERRALIAGLFPLAFLLASLLLTRLLPALREGLAGALPIDLPALDFKMAPFHHPGFWLVMAALVGLPALGIGRAAFGRLLSAALRQWGRAALSVAGFLCCGQVMAESGMIDRLAESLAAGAGSAYPAIIPLIGGLGGFLTASNAASNALFMQFQMSVAGQAGLPLDLTAAAQNAAGANMTLASPGRLVLAAAVIDRPGSEPELLRQVLPLALFGLATATALTWWLMRG